MIVFKLKSSKVFFIFGSWLSIVVGGFAVFKEKKQNGFLVESERLIAGNLLQFIAITVVLLLNLYFTAKLIEGIVFRLPYKVLQWIIVNFVNIVQLAILSVKIDTPIGYLAFIIFFYVWSAMIFVFMELNRSLSAAAFAESQQQSAVEPTVSYVTFSNDTSDTDKQEP